MAQVLLSRRELQVLKLRANGLTQEEIADELGISIKSVEVYRNSIALKCGCSFKSSVSIFLRNPDDFSYIRGINQLKAKASRLRAYMLLKYKRLTKKQIAQRLGLGYDTILRYLKFESK